MRTQKDVKVGENAAVVKLRGEGAVKRHGHHPGRGGSRAEGAPLGDPMELSVRGYELSVRKADAEMIEVE